MRNTARYFRCRHRAVRWSTATLAGGGVVDDFIEEVWSTSEGELRKRWPTAVISASAPERGSDERRLGIRTGDQSHTLILGPRVMDREDAPAVIRALREGAWIPLLWEYRCVRVEYSDDGYHLVLCWSPDSSRP